MSTDDPHLASIIQFPSQDETSHRRLAETVQALMLHGGRTLTDEDAEQTYQVTLDAVLLLLEGAHVHDIINEEQYNRLRALYEGMKRVPDFL